MRELQKRKNFILKSSVIFALVVAFIAGVTDNIVLLFAVLGYLLFMLINNWCYVVGKKDDIEDLLDAQEDYRMIRLFKRDEL